jgi:hypothetical protein
VLQRIRRAGGASEASRDRAWNIVARACALLAVYSAPSLAQLSPSDQPSPRTWLAIGEGVSFIAGKDSRGTVISHTPLVGVGRRYSDFWGVEGAISFASTIGAPSEAVADFRLQPPNLSIISASIVTVRGTRAVPFTQMAGFGVGVYRESGSGQPKTDLGFQAYIDTGSNLYGPGMLCWGLKGVYLPNGGSGNLFSVGVTLTLRTK